MSLACADLLGQWLLTHADIVPVHIGGERNVTGLVRLPWTKAALGFVLYGVLAFVLFSGRAVHNMSRSALTSYFSLFFSFLVTLGLWHDLHLDICFKSACCRDVLCAWEAILGSLVPLLLFTSLLTVSFGSGCYWLNAESGVFLVPLTITGKVIYSFTFENVSL